MSATALVFLVCLVLPSLSSAEQQRFEAAESKDVQATRGERTVRLLIAAKMDGPVTIPRLAAPLRSMHWEGEDADAGLRLKPEQETWIITWKKRPKGDATLVLEFDAEPLLLSEVTPAEPAGDGSFYLPAHLAVTRGEKIRYEPQPYKNTVGYWAGKEDSAAWTIKLDQPGRFSVAVLQGCGRGQGGSQASISFISPVKDVYPSIDFEVVETGHFQNFQWHHLGEVQIRHTEVEVIVAPKNISKGALMDIRAVHLVRLPDAKP